MSRSFKALILGSCLFAGLFAAGFNSLEAASGRWGAYSNGQPAWGGNGGWWGGGSTDWYGDNSYQNGYDGDGTYSYDYSHPYSQHYYADPNAPGASAGVNGSGFYFNVR